MTPKTMQRLSRTTAIRLRELQIPTKTWLQIPPGIRYGFYKGMVMLITRRSKTPEGKSQIQIGFYSPTLPKSFFRSKSK